MRGGRRPGAGRPKTVEGTRRHFLYSTEEEYRQAKKRLAWEREKAKAEFFMDEEDYVFDCLASTVPGQPIFLETLFESSHGRIESIDRYREIVEKIARENPGFKIREYRQGIYYRTIKMRCSDMEIDCEEIIRWKYMRDDGWHRTGHDLLNKMGLTAMVPVYSEIVSNSIKEETVDEEYKVRIYPAKEKITRENRLYFTVLDALRMIEDPCIDADHPILLIEDYIRKQKLDFRKLEEFAGRCDDASIHRAMALCRKTYCIR